MVKTGSTIPFSVRMGGQSQTLVEQIEVEGGEDEMGERVWGASPWSTSRNIVSCRLPIVLCFYPSLALVF